MTTPATQKLVDPRDAPRSSAAYRRCHGHTDRTIHYSTSECGDVRDDRRRRGPGRLAVGYYLKRRGRSFVVLDANERIGGSWRTRTWDSLRLFTPARFDGLPGWPFPAPAWSYPTARETADYLEAYAARFDLPVRLRTPVDRLERDGDRYVVESGGRRFEADNIVVATGFYGVPSVPAFVSEMDPRIVQMHSSHYRSPAQLQPGGVLLVGAGNSGADIAMELSKTHRVWLSGPDKGQVPLRIESRKARVVLPVLWFIGSRVLTIRTPIGRRARPHVLKDGAPLIRVKAADLAAAGVERVAKTIGMRDGWPLLEDGGVLDVANVIWCTGFRQDFSWIEAPVFGEDGEPVHTRGACTEPGLYFVGLDFLYAFTSENVGGVGRDAKHIVKCIAERDA
jgi:putative flavoprotein involved in K+ transport